MQGQYGGGAYVAPDGSRQQAQYAQPQQQTVVMVQQQPAMVAQRPMARVPMVDPVLSPNLERVRAELMNLVTAELIISVILVITSWATQTWFLGCCLGCTALMCRTHWQRPWALMNNTCLVRPETVPTVAFFLHGLLILGSLFVLVVDALWIHRHAQVDSSSFLFYMAIGGLVATLASLIIVSMATFKISVFRPLFQREHITHMQQQSQQQLGNNLGGGLQQPLMMAAAPTSPAAGGGYYAQPQQPVMGSVAPQSNNARVESGGGVYGNSGARSNDMNPWGQSKDIEMVNEQPRGKTSAPTPY